MLFVRRNFEDMLYYIYVNSGSADPQSQCAEVYPAACILFAANQHFQCTGSSRSPGSGATVCAWNCLQRINGAGFCDSQQTAPHSLEYNSNPNHRDSFGALL